MPQGGNNMAIFNFKPEHDLMGLVSSVDTANVTIRIDDSDKLKTLQVNRLVCLETVKPGQYLIGTVQRIVRRRDGEDGMTDQLEDNSCKIALLGTYFTARGSENGVFQRTLKTVPEIYAKCYPIEGEHLSSFMQVISKVSDASTPLRLGHYSLSDDSVALLNGNKLFQRHAVIVGSTGSGKSWTTATLLEQIAALNNPNTILFDIHGEYTPITGEKIRHLHIANPSDLDTENNLDSGTVYLPYWLLG
mgnify:CR=1 FL=1